MTVSATIPRIDPRFSQLPVALRERTLFARLGPYRTVPVLLAHPDPDWRLAVDDADALSRPAPTPRPVMLWFHGRTVNKELDPGRYLRWLRCDAGGLAVCAVDLPGHGERLDPHLQRPERTLDVVAAAVEEVDAILADLAHPRWRGAFDVTRCAIGGMSAGGMVTLMRLCSEHPFSAAAVEATTGDFAPLVERGLYQREAAERLAPIGRLRTWRPIPLLALHSEADQWVPWSAMRGFLDALQGHYQHVGADPALVRRKVWASTGAPNEHWGFGRVSNEAKNLQTAFLVEALLGLPGR